MPSLAKAGSAAAVMLRTVPFSGQFSVSVNASVSCWGAGASLFLVFAASFSASIFFQKKRVTRAETAIDNNSPMANIGQSCGKTEMKPGMPAAPSA